MTNCEIFVGNFHSLRFLPEVLSSWDMLIYTWIKLHFWLSIECGDLFLDIFLFFFSLKLQNNQSASIKWIIFILALNSFKNLYDLTLTKQEFTSFWSQLPILYHLNTKRMQNACINIKSHIMHWITRKNSQNNVVNMAEIIFPINL